MCLLLIAINLKCAAGSQGGLGKLQLCYLRHAFGLGEHYNSVKALTEVDDHHDKGDIG